MYNFTVNIYHFSHKKINAEDILNRKRHDFIQWPQVPHHIFDKLSKPGTKTKRTGETRRRSLANSIVLYITTIHVVHFLPFDVGKRRGICVKSVPGYTLNCTLNQHHEHPE